MRQASSIAVILAAIALAAPSYGLTADEKDQVCPAMGALAKEVMTGRQKGIAMSKMMAALKNDDPTANELIRGIITEAYSQPQYRTDKVIKDTIAEFQNSMEYECYK